MITDIAAGSLLLVAALRLYVPAKSLENVVFALLLLIVAALLIFLPGGPK